jgi:hypothetical protein
MKTMTAETKVETEVKKSRTVTAVTVLVCAWPALLLAAACLLPFLNKPFVIDDPHFLTMAQQIVKHPTHPMDFTICWNEPATCTKAYLLTPGDALMGYVLVPTVLSGAHEWMAHLTQLVLCWMAILAMASLVLWFGWDRWHARVGALLLAAIPPFLPMASTAMPDILATALAVVGMERLAAWKAEEKWGQGTAAAAALGLAGFARPHLALLLPLAAFFLFESANPREMAAQIRRRAWLWIPVIAGGALLIAVLLAVREHNLAISPPSVVVGWGKIPFNLPAYMLFFVLPLPLAACWVANRLRMRRLRPVAKLIAAALVMSAVPWFLHWGQPLVFFLATIGCGVLCSLLMEAWRTRDHTLIFLVLWILIPFPIVIYDQLPMKYVLPCVPAVILLCFRLMEVLPVRVMRAAFIALIVASTGYSVLILRSDAEFAEFGRDALHSLITPHVAAGKTVWYPGQYWSYWYAPLDGAKLTYPGGPQPRPGDLLVVDVFAAGEDAPLSRFPHRTLVQTISHKYRFGRTMGAGIGLYSNWYGDWLWGFGDSGRDRFELWRIE